MTFKCERHLIRGQFDVFIDRHASTEDVRVSVYRGETLLAIEFIQTLETVIDRLVDVAKVRAPQFPADSQ